MRLQEGANLWVQLRWALVVALGLVELNLCTHVVLSTAQMCGMSRFSKRPLPKTVSWMLRKDSLLFEFAREFRRKGWWISYTISLSDRLQRCAMSALCPGSDVASHSIVKGGGSKGGGQRPTKLCTISKNFAAGRRKCVCAFVCTCNLFSKDVYFALKQYRGVC